MNKSIDCRKKEYRSSMKCEFKNIHNKICKSRNSEFGNATKTVFSLTSPQAAAIVAGVDISKAAYKGLFCRK